MDVCKTGCERVGGKEMRKGSICDPYKDKIIELVELGFSLKEIWEMLKREKDMYTCYETFVAYCNKKNIKSKITRICDNCKYDARYPVNGRKEGIRICTLRKQGHYSKTVPRFCNGGFERK